MANRFLTVVAPSPGCTCGSLQGRAREAHPGGEGAPPPPRARPRGGLPPPPGPRHGRPAGVRAGAGDVLRRLAGRGAGGAPALAERPGVGRGTRATGRTDRTGTEGG